MPKAITVVTRLPKLEQKKRVAAYARVSSGKDAMLHSLSAQVSFYSDMIQRHDNWLYVGVYADEAKTGTKESRPDFQRLIADCRAGKIDMVITKSISRFARNTVTLLQTVRDFKAWGVDIYFEEQNIHTLSSDGELMITILASYAQEESRSASENQKWRIRRNFEEGVPGKAYMLGYRQRGTKYEVVPEEAAIVRRIFNDYLSGMGYAAIASSLNDDSIPSFFDKKWCQTAVLSVLNNYAYTGNLILQQTFRENHLTKRKIKNAGQFPQFHVEDSHEAIIDHETFLAVQKERQRRASRFGSRKQKGTYPLTSMMTCANCGKKYRRKIVTQGPVWICSTYNTKGKGACASKQIPEDILLTVTARVLGTDTVTAELVQEQLSGITVADGNELNFHFRDGRTISHRWQDRSRSESWTPEMKEAARQKALEWRKQNA
jgi:DNA invertase Pin-like site-specific DNA recombinase